MEPTPLERDSFTAFLLPDRALELRGCSSGTGINVSGFTASLGTSGEELVYLKQALSSLE